MFGADYWADDHFGADYWGDGVPVVPVPSGGGGHSEIVYRKTRHKPHPVTIDAWKATRPAYEWITTDGGIVFSGGAVTSGAPAPPTPAAYQQPVQAAAVAVLTEAPTSPTSALIAGPAQEAAAVEAVAAVGATTDAAQAKRLALLADEQEAEDLLLWDLL